jgi:hypothetical protein
MYVKGAFGPLFRWGSLLGRAPDGSVPFEDPRAQPRSDNIGAVAGVNARHSLPPALLAEFNCAPGLHVAELITAPLAADRAPAPPAGRCYPSPA